MRSNSNRAVCLARRIIPLALLSLATVSVASEPFREDIEALLARIGTKKDICVVLGLPGPDRPEFVTDLVRASDLLVYFQSADPREVVGVRAAAEKAGLLGERVFVDDGDPGSIHLADNLAGAVLVGPSARVRVKDAELLRVLHPEGKAIVADREIVKPLPPGTDDWSHPHHGPDNNPQSADQAARAPYLTQFLADPKFSPMPEVTVVAGGKVFKAFGHIAHKANQNAVLNTLLCINAYNGMILWRRQLSGRFMIHRNTMIATPGSLYLADHESCKVIDADTGEIRGRIVIPEGMADGPVWKWMGFENGVLYALLGGREAAITTRRSDRRGLGHWPWGMWDGHDYRNPRTSFGFGRTFVAIDPATRKVLWNHREEESIDSRGVCMKNGRIYFYAPEKYLACLDTDSRKVRWRTSDPELLAAIGPNGRAQHYVTGYATTTYIKCSDRQIFFAGPQRSRLVVVDAEEGKLRWQREGGNLQLVLRDDGFYAAGPEGSGRKLDYETGAVLASLPQRRACTRATGSVDSVFFRTRGGTVRVECATNTAKHISPMRPPCQDGVIISNGLLYWGPWMCGCELSLYGHICLGPAGDFDFQPPADASRLERGPGDWSSVAELEVTPADWPAYRADSRRSSVTRVAVPRSVREKWRFRASTGGLPTAPVAAGGLVFFGDRKGVVRALGDDGKLRWKAHASGPIYYPPAVARGRAYVGSADGRVYAFEAATGRLLWRFRLAPAERWIPVYGRLISTWPVAGGVIVEDGVVYAAAGVAHYDGTYVVALDAVTGEVKWLNDSSGTIAERVESGISLQGELYVEGGELRFLGGGVYRTARYDLKTGRCLNAPREVVTSSFQTAFSPYYPYYGQYLSLHRTFPDGKTVAYDASYEGSKHSRLALFAPARGSRKAAPRVPGRSPPKRRDRRDVLWQTSDRRYNSWVVAPGTLIAAGQTGPDDDAFLAAIRLGDGSDAWVEKLPTPAVRGGALIDREGRIIVTVQGGDVICYAGE